MSNEPHGRLDHAIDRAVRDMMQVDPAPGIRHRVLGRLERPHARRPLLLPLAIAAALAVVILSVALLRPAAPTPEPRYQVVSGPPAAGVAHEPVASAAPALPTNRTASAPERPRPAPSDRRPSRTLPRPSAIFPDTPGRVRAANVSPASPAASAEAPGAAPLPEPLTPIAPITIAPMTTGAQTQDDKQKPTEQPTPRPEAAGQPINIKLDLTITEQNGTGDPVKKVVTMMLAESGSGSIRSTSNVKPQGRVQLNVDAQIQMLKSGALRTTFRLEYTPRLNGNEAGGEWTSLSQQIQTVLEPGKPMILSQATDPASDRKVIVEVKATVVK